MGRGREIGAVGRRGQEGASEMSACDRSAHLRGFHGEDYRGGSVRVGEIGEHG